MDCLNYDHADAAPASDYIGSVLVLKSTASPVGVWSNDTLTSRLIRTIQPGGTVGTIYSYVKDTNGEVWWLLTDNNFVKHRTGVFDLKTAQATSDLYTQQAATAKADKENLANQITNAGGKVVTGVSDLVGGAGDVLAGLGKNFQWVIIIAIVAVIAYGVHTYKEA